MGAPAGESYDDSPPKQQKTGGDRIFDTLVQRVFLRWNITPPGSFAPLPPAWTWISEAIAGAHAARCAR